MKNYTDRCSCTNAVATAKVALYSGLVMFHRLEHASICTGVSHITVPHNRSFTHLFTLIKMWWILSEVENQNIAFDHHFTERVGLFRIITCFFIRIFKDLSPVFLINLRIFFTFSVSLYVKLFCWMYITHITPPPNEWAYRRFLLYKENKICKYMYITKYGNKKYKFVIKWHVTSSLILVDWMNIQLRSILAHGYAFISFILNIFQNIYVRWNIYIYIYIYVSIYKLIEFKTSFLRLYNAESWRE
jgi:hypothetical protein